MPDPGGVLPPEMGETVSPSNSRDWKLPGKLGKSRHVDLFESLEMDGAASAEKRQGYGSMRQQRREGAASSSGPRDRLKPGRFMGLAISREVAGVMIGYMAQVRMLHVTSARHAMATVP